MLLIIIKFVQVNKFQSSNNFHPQLLVKSIVAISRKSYSRNHFIHCDEYSANASMVQSFFTFFNIFRNAFSRYHTRSESSYKCYNRSSPLWNCKPVLSCKTWLGLYQQVDEKLEPNIVLSFTKLSRGVYHHQLECWLNFSALGFFLHFFPILSEYGVLLHGTGNGTLQGTLLKCTWKLLCHYM